MRNGCCTRSGQWLDENDNANENPWQIAKPSLRLS